MTADSARYNLCLKLFAEVTHVVQKAKEQGDFLLVGLHTDEDVSERRGLHLPIMDLHERCLSVLACKYVDEVIIGAPPQLVLQHNMQHEPLKWQFVSAVLPDNIQHEPSEWQFVSTVLPYNMQHEPLIRQFVSGRLHTRPACPICI